MDKYVLRAQLLSNEFVFVRLLDSDHYVTTGYIMLATTFPDKKTAKVAWQMLIEEGESSHDMEFKPVKLYDQ